MKNGLPRFIPQRRARQGDTLVEVLIAIAVITSVLAGAFTVVKMSAIGVRNSQEQSEMLQILQGQIELVRALALKETGTTGGIYSKSPRYFCVNTDSTSPDYGTKLSFDASFVLKPIESDNFNDYKAGCKNLQTYYNVAVTYDQASKAFVFTGRWDRIGGSRNQEKLVYRIYPGQAAPAPVYTAPITFDPTDPSLAARLSEPPPKRGGGGGGGGGGGEKSGPCWETRGWTHFTCWRGRVANVSPNPAGLVARCVYNWGDGSDPDRYDGSDKECQTGSVVTHDFIPQGAPPKKITFKVVLTNYGYNGLVISSNTVDITRPK